MIRIHWLMCFPRRMAYFWYGLLVLLAFAFYFFATDLIQSTTYFQNDQMIPLQYKIRGIELIKWGMLSLSMALVLMAFAVQKYTIMMMYYTSKRYVIVLKVLILDGILVLWIILALSILFTVGKWIGHFSFTQKEFTSILQYSVLFGLLYQHWMIFLYMTLKHIVMIPFVHVMYVFASSTLDYFMKKNDASLSLEAIQLVVPDLIVYDSLSIELFHSALWYLIVVIALFYGIYSVFMVSDITK